MASSRSHQSRMVITRTEETRGPDGKLERRTYREEKEEDLSGDSASKPRSLLAGFFGRSKEPQKSLLSRPESASDDDVNSLLKPTGRLTTQDASDSKAASQSLDEFRKQALDVHNKHRKAHGVEPLKLNEDLTKHAQEWAEHMAKSGRFQHRQQSKYGENIFFGGKTGGFTGEEVVNTWYAENKNYSFSNCGRSTQPNTGHFTQVVWKGSRELGLGKAESGPGQVFVVANYSPAGNMLGSFADNVFPRKH